MPPQLYCSFSFSFRFRAVPGPDLPSARPLLHTAHRHGSTQVPRRDLVRRTYLSPALSQHPSDLTSFPVPVPVSVPAPDSGGGVGGLVCAVALSRHPDIHIDVYEAAAAFTEIGAGIGVWPRAWKVLCALGLAEDLAKIAVVPPTDLPRACCVVSCCVVLVFEACSDYLLTAFTLSCPALALS